MMPGGVQELFPGNTRTQPARFGIPPSWQGWLEAEAPSTDADSTRDGPDAPLRHPPHHPAFIATAPSSRQRSGADEGDVSNCPNRLVDRTPGRAWPGRAPGRTDGMHPTAVAGRAEYLLADEAACSTGAPSQSATWPTSTCNAAWSPLGFTIALRRRRLHERRRADISPSPWRRRTPRRPRREQPATAPPRRSAGARKHVGRPPAWTWRCQAVADRAVSDTCSVARHQHCEASGDPDRRRAPPGSRPVRTGPDCRWRCCWDFRLVVADPRTCGVAESFCMTIR